jgi:hypothetical protein
MTMKRASLRVMPVDISDGPSVSLSARKELIPTRCHWAICGSTQSGKQQQQQQHNIVLMFWLFRKNDVRDQRLQEA